MMRSFFLLLCISFSCVSDEQLNTVRVIGQGSVAATPDLFEFSVYVEEKGPIIQKLNASAGDKTKQIIQFLREQKVADKDIQALQLSLYPWYEHRQRQREQKGFHLSRQIKVKLRDIKRYDRVLDGVTRYGVNRIDGIRFSLEHPDKRYLEALRLAVANAQSRAAELARSTGATLGPVIKINELTQYNPAPQMMEARAMSDSGSASAGEVGIGAQVEVLFALESEQKD